MMMMMMMIVNAAITLLHCET